MRQKLADWFRGIGDSLRRFLYGRYGTDRLNTVLLVAALACSLLGMIPVLAFLHFFFYAFFIYAVFRTFSKNIEARRRENAAFTHFLKFFTDRQYRYYTCPSCGQTVRVPRGKGKISIRCPRCAQRFEKKT